MATTTPNRNDVLFGRGHILNNHSGNQRYRGLVESRRPQFLQSKKRKDKRAIAAAIVEEIRGSRPAGRFLMESSLPGNFDATTDGRLDPCVTTSAGVHPSILNKAWVVVDEDKVMNKVLHRLREKPPVGSGGEWKSKKDAAMPRSPDDALPMNGRVESNEVALRDATLFDLDAKSDETIIQKRQAEEDYGRSGQMNSFSIMSSLCGGGSESAPSNAHGQTNDEFVLPAAFDAQDGGIEGFQYNGNGPHSAPNNANSELGDEGQLDDDFLLPFGAQDDGSAGFQYGGNGSHSAPNYARTQQLDDDFLLPFGAQDDRSGGFQNSGNGSNSAHAQLQLDDDFSLPAGFGAQDDGGFQYSGNRSKSAPNDEHAQLAEELDSFLLDLSAHDGHAPELQEISLREWIEKSKPKPELVTSTLPSSEEMYKYVKSALPIALKLTKFLIEAEKDESNHGLPNSVPLESICSENVLVRSKRLHLGEGSIDWPGVEGIDYVMIMSSMGEKSYSGNNMSRLYALGIVFYELFSGGEEPLLENTSDDFGASLPTLSSIHLGNEANGNYRPQKKSLQSRNNLRLADISRLESSGIPNSLRTLLENLFESGKGDLSGDEAYTSFTDLRLDLQLMVDNPTCFLENITTNPIPQLQIPCKLFGRDAEISKIEESYQLHTSGKCNGVIIAGRAGVGKTRLAMHAQNVANRFNSNSLFFSAKFCQSKDTQPLQTIGAMFNEICEVYVQNSTQAQLLSLEAALESALGAQAALITAIVPSLGKLMPPSGELSPTTSCVNSSLSLRFLFSELLDVFAAHCPEATFSFVIDDLQWAERISLLLIKTLISNIEGKGAPIFFICCYRDDEVDDSFRQWVSSVSTTSLELIKLEDMTTDGVNSLLSETLQLSPRLTRPLSSALHHKSRGNALFLRRLLGSLEEQSLVYFNLQEPARWSWDLEKILDLRISDDVVELLVHEMKQLPADHVLGLKVLSCLGSSAKCPILDILAHDLGVNLQDILQQVSDRGFLDYEGSVFSFAHDKIQQAATEMMLEQERKEFHMRFGLALCAQSMAGSVEDDEIFFVSVSQINRAGPELAREPSQRDVISQLNLKAGKRALQLSDFAAGYQLFKHGISFLNPDHWETQYYLSLDLYDAAAEAACMTNNRDAVVKYSDTLVANARSYDDKLNCLYTATKALRHAELLHESLQSTFSIFDAIGEERPRHMGDSKLSSDINAMEDTLNDTTDVSIYNLPKINSKRIDTVLKLYANLRQVLYFTDPSLAVAVSLRMIEITMKSGFTSLSTSALAGYGEVLASMGKYDLACRLGRLAMRLLEKDLSAYKTTVICHVYSGIFWVSTPFQSIVAAHKLGHKSGKQAGDFLYATLNLQLAITTSWVAGETLDTVKRDIQAFIVNMQSIKNMAFVGNSILLLNSAAVLIGGRDVVGVGQADNIPAEREILSDARLSKDNNFSLGKKIHRAVRMFHFRQFDEDPAEFNVSETILEEKHQLRPLLLMGLFYDALICFQRSRHVNDSANWMQKGEYTLSQFKCWSDHSMWNFEAIKYVLEAERESILGTFEKAEHLYLSSIKAAKKHKFIHIEACASELGGLFYYETGSLQKAIELLKHSIDCYKKWGALAVSRRVQTFIDEKVGSDFGDLEANDFVSKHLSSSDTGSSKKRDELG